nr:phosphotransferase [Chloroflexota bacterium]
VAKGEISRWLGDERVSALGEILTGENTRLAEIHEQPSLTHGDFNPTNILIHEGEVSAVLDWEYGHAGTPYMDIGNLLRNTDQQHHESIGRGLVEGGFDLPDDWIERAALIDVSSHLEFLTSTRSDEFKRSRIALIDSFIKIFRS